jgi:predicted DCC family thiol-disulfide oxidoreductase YuxK
MTSCDRMTVFYDGACPVCALEIDTLAARDRERRLDLVDIAAPDFDAARHGFVHADLDAAMHVRCADGHVVRGVPALRLVYEAAGLGWLVRPTAWPVVGGIAAAAYRGFARRRHSISRALTPVVDLVRSARGLRRRAG